MDPIAALATATDKIAPKLREEILALGEAAVPDLIAILKDEDLSAMDGPSGGWAPIHAVGLLAELKAEAAIGPMLRLLVETTFDEIVHDRLLQALPRFGAPVLEPAIELLAKAEENEDARHSLASVLAGIGVRDERVFKAICRVFDDDASLGAMLFAEYGDADAVPILEGAVESFQPDFTSVMSRIELVEHVCAIEMLGRKLDEETQRRVDGWMAEWRRQLRLPADDTRAGQQRRVKVGRNDPCPCGSGKKYKKCCLP